MIHSIKKYFRSKKNKYYQDELIAKLNQEHQKLFEIVGLMDQSVEKRDKKEIKKHIKNFIETLELHLLYEDSNLYEHLYLRFCYYKISREEILKKHNQMKEIALVVENFIKKHQELNDFDGFIEEFAVIKNVLVKRIKFEEEILYELYDGCYDPKIVVEKLQNSALK